MINGKFGCLQWDKRMAKTAEMLVKGRMARKGKGRDIGYALAASSCEGAHSVEYAPSRPSMRSLLSQFQTPTTPRRAVGFFGSGRSLGRPSELITQLTLDWLLFILANPFSRRRGQR